MAIKGIDVSAWNGRIDWNAVKNAGYNFAILKAGGSDDGIYTDSRFEENYKNAKAAGMPVGAYWFIGRACTTEVDGKADAERFLRLLKGKKFEYPVYVDVESTLPSQRSYVTTAVIAFCRALEAAGWYAGIYGSTYSTFQSRLDDSRLTGFAHWVAQYASSCSYWNSYGIWQYSSDGYIAGHGCRFDLNYCYVDYPTIIKAKGLNGFEKTSGGTGTVSETPKKEKYTPLKVDGVFGQVSVKALQTMLNVELNAGLDVDGVAGPATWTALQKYINKWIEKQNK